MKHGRAVMPFGKWKGVRLRLIPDDYLSWMTSSEILKAPQWRWLWDSLIAELRFRGMKAELAATADVEIESCGNLLDRPRRRFRL